MTDKELLELAAKAAGIEWLHYNSGYGKGLCCREPSALIEYYWNPLTDDGDALRLAVKLKLHIGVAARSNQRYSGRHDFDSMIYEDATDDQYAATRRAIVRAAAEIGKGMK